ncbi:hypothetical protein CWS20_12625 [Cytobacillus horneckiae]|uniref:Uncharacterized protein n=1 Tax=Cytobacillus horneckiae TaxID=549687 RepID=A0A2N0ZGG8_9BACI|nr:hypothetical protein CWS20_12625 [Cytobacillus horneckiae]
MLSVNDQQRSFTEIKAIYLCEETKKKSVHRDKTDISHLRHQKMRAVHHRIIQIIGAPMNAQFPIAS